MKVLKRDFRPLIAEKILRMDNRTFFIHEFWKCPLDLNELRHKIEFQLLDKIEERNDY